MSNHISELLEKHFDTAVAAPDGIKKLRELILTLAMQGKLVPQDLSEQPVRNLLENIQAKKEHLVAEGKIKRQKPPLPVTEEEELYDLPQSWQWVRFGEIAQHNSGKTLDAGRNSGLLRRYITTSNVYWGKLQLDNVREMPIREDELDKCSVREGDLLICEGGEAGRAAVWNLPGEICFQNHVHRARFYGDIDPYFVYRFFEKLNYSGLIDKYRKGVGISNMSSKALASVVIPLPPASEQRRIVAVIDELMARCDELERLSIARDSARLSVHQAAIKHLLNIAQPERHRRAKDFLVENFGELYAVKENVIELRRAILQLAMMGMLEPQNPGDQPASELLKLIEVEKQRLVKEGAIKSPKPLLPVTEEEWPYALPCGWEWVRFFAPNTVRSELVSASDFPEENQIAPDTIEKDTGRLLLHRTVEDSGVTGPNNRFYEGQILYSKIRPSLNKAIIAPYNGLCSADMYPVICHANSDFMIKVILSETFLAQARRAENRVKMPKLNLESLGQILIPFPPAAEQKRIVGRVEQLMAQCDIIDRKIEVATNKRSLLLAAVMAKVQGVLCV